MLSLSLRTAPICDTPAFTQYAHQVARLAADEERIGQFQDSLPLAAEDLDKTETHDCQRLIQGSQLGTLAAVLVNQRALSSPGGFTAGKFVAEVIAWDGAYPRLGIQQGVNCLWLTGDPARNDGWAAEMRPAAGGSCRGAGVAPSGMPLTVRRLTHGGNVYPSTGRWMWDSVNRVQFIGVRCGNAWCEVGMQGFVGTPAIAHQDSVPGWYDEQLLSYVPPGATTLVASGILGRIEPSHEYRHSSDKPNFGRRRAGAHVATVTFQGNDPPVLEIYRQKYALPAGATSGGIFMRVYRPLIIIGDFTRQSRGPGRTWQDARYTPHVHHAPEGAVRWSWDETDEKGWYPCDRGCCETDHHREI